MFTYIYIVFHQSFLTTAHLNIQNVNIPAGFQKHHRYPPVGHLESAYPFVQVQSPSSACLLERIYGTENALNLKFLWLNSTIIKHGF